MGAEAEKERLRDQGDVRQAALERSSRRELENSLLESRREVNERCDEVDNERCVYVCLLNDQMHNIQQTYFDQGVDNLQGQMQDVQLRIDQANDHAEEENLRLRAQGLRREAALQRVSERELENALQDCIIEVNKTCGKVDDTLFMDECQLNDKI